MEPDSARSPSPSPPSSPVSPDREDAPLVIDIADEEMSAPECGSASSEDDAVTPDVLRLREELEALQRELRRELIARVSGTRPPPSLRVGELICLNMGFGAKITYTNSAI